MNTRKRNQKTCGNHKFILFPALFILFFAVFIPVSPALAVPETTAVRITDVTTSSFSVVWMTDVAADPSVEVYTDNSMQQRVTDGIVLTPMPAGSAKVAESARQKGIMKVRVSGLLPASTYYARAVTKDPANTDSVSYSSLQQVTTASTVLLYEDADGAAQGLENDLVDFPVYVRPSDMTAEPGLGDLVILEDQNGLYPISSFVGDGALSPEGVLDLNNLFGSDGTSLHVTGAEKITVTIYRAGNISTLTHYRKAPQNSNTVSIAGLLSGFFADINLDGTVDDQDFMLFKAQYRTVPDDAVYNPDYNFVDDPEGKVDVREFSKFSKEYGRTDVQ